MVVLDDRVEWVLPVELKAHRVYCKNQKGMRLSAAKFDADTNLAFTVDGQNPALL